MWKDTSPGYQTPQGPGGPQPGTVRQTYDYYRSNPTSPTQQATAVYPPPRSANTYHPALRGGVPVFPPAPQQSPQVRRKVQQQPQNMAPQQDNRRRPMSFIRALEMTDSVEMGPKGAPPQRSDTPDRTSVYDMNYEISV